MFWISINGFYIFMSFIFNSCNFTFIFTKQDTQENKEEPKGSENC